MTSMSRQYVRENDIARRYLGNTLTPEEAAEFEVFLMDNPDELEQVELDAVFSRTLADVKTEKKERLKLISSWLRPALAFALGLVIALPVMYLLVPGESALDAGQANIVYVERLRSGDQRQRSVDIAVPGGSQALVVVISPIHAGKEAYSAVLFKDDTALLRISDIQPDEMGDITLLLPGTVMNDAPIRLELEQENGAKESILLKAAKP